MNSIHKIYFQSSKKMSLVPSNSIDLVITSPPYPMIKMWDDMFSKQNSLISDALQDSDGQTAFELMHQELDYVWDEVSRVMKNSAFACINIGDATRTINGNFGLYSNHTRILQYFLSIGFTALPDILWRKQTNAPNKFMGSGMLPAGAYVTLEHEYVLIFRKGPKREFKKQSEKKNRLKSAYFWEERNAFFSDIWFDIKGSLQSLSESDERKRSAAFPFELPYRLINMYSAKTDIILDPFAGIGTSMAAAMASARNSVGYEIDHGLRNAIYGIKDNIVDFSNKYILNRLNRHVSFVQEKMLSKGALSFKYQNRHYAFPVTTRQEKELILNKLTDVREVDNNMFEVSYSDASQF